MDSNTIISPVSAEDGGMLRDHVYNRLRGSLMTGHYTPGQKLVIRQLADQLGTSLTPIREGLARLVAEGVLESEANRSARVPRMTGQKFRELRDIRMAVEGLAVRRAAERISAQDVAELRRIAGALIEARTRGDVAADVNLQGEFQLGVYRTAAMPNLMRIIESLWVQTGPYLKLLFPHYIKIAMERRGHWRDRLCNALEAHDADAAYKEIIADLSESLDYLTTVVDAAESIGRS